MLEIADAVQLEGHVVKLFNEYRPWHQIGDGFVPKARNREQHIDQSELIVFDHTGYGKQTAALRAAGKLVIGGTKYTERLEPDRSFGQSELRRHKAGIIDHDRLRQQTSVNLALCRYVL